jgi:DNA-binding GntR family transcriptional regulator
MNRWSTVGFVVAGPRPAGQRNTQTTPLSKSFAQAVHEQLREEILAGVLRPGERLREAEVAARLGTSQGPVREAFSRLREQGFIISFPHRGSYVTEISKEEALDVYSIIEILDVCGFVIEFH